jgi:hypothetical protein
LILARFTPRVSRDFFNLILAGSTPRVSRDFFKFDFSWIHTKG